MTFITQGMYCIRCSLHTMSDDWYAGYSVILPFPSIVYVGSSMCACVHMCVHACMVCGMHVLCLYMWVCLCVTGNNSGIHLCIHEVICISPVSDYWYVCACLCLCEFVCICAYMNMFMHVCIHYVCLCLYVEVCVHTWVYSHIILVGVCVVVGVYVFAHMCSCMCVHACVCMHVCAYMTAGPVGLPLHMMIASISFCEESS